MNCSRPYIEFHYSDTGKGTLVIHRSCDDTKVFQARSGSIDSLGRLKNVIDKGVWWILKPHEFTTEKGMMIKGHKSSWKTRLYNKNKNYTHYLIHPDGNLPGSRGCIVTPGISLDLRDIIDEMLKEVNEIPVYINVRPKC